MATEAAVVIQCQWLIQSELFSHWLSKELEEVITKAGSPRKSAQCTLENAFGEKNTSDECTFVSAGKSGSRCWLNNLREDWRLVNNLWAVMKCCVSFFLVGKKQWLPTPVMQWNPAHTAQKQWAVAYLPLICFHLRPRWSPMDLALSLLILWGCK